MYAKDLAVVRSHDIEDDDAIHSIINEPPNEEEIQELVTRREENARFDDAAMFKSGTKNISEDIHTIKEHLMNQKGIVEER